MMIDFNDYEQVVNKLEELKNMNLPHMTIERFSNICPSFSKDIKKATEKEKETISEELKPFCRPESENKCIFSGEWPSLRWGLTHGSAYDENTGFSWRCIHYFTINGVSHKYDVDLQYHPDSYEVAGD